MVFPQLVILVLVVAFLWFFYGTSVVVGDSMLPNLIDGDRVLVAKAYNAPVRSDVIVFGHSDPQDGVGVIKRVIGIPGDTVEVRAGEAVVNGSPEDDGYEVFTTPIDVSANPLTVPPDHLYVLGDNRPVSADSRFFGTVPLDKVQGRAVWIIWPPDRMGTVDGVRE